MLCTHTTGPSTAIITVASHSVYLTHVQFIDVVPEVGLILDIKIGHRSYRPNHGVDDPSALPSPTSTPHSSQ